MTALDPKTNRQPCNHSFIISKEWFTSIGHFTYISTWNGTFGNGPLTLKAPGLLPHEPCSTTTTKVMRERDDSCMTLCSTLFCLQPWSLKSQYPICCLRLLPQGLVYVQLLWLYKWTTRQKSKPRKKVFRLFFFLGIPEKNNNDNTQLPGCVTSAQPKYHTEKHNLNDISLADASKMLALTCLFLVALKSSIVIGSIRSYESDQGQLEILVWGFR